jgi:hypothetical protein
MLSPKIAQLLTEIEKLPIDQQEMHAITTILVAWWL